MHLFLAGFWKTNKEKMRKKLRKKEIKLPKPKEKIVEKAKMKERKNTTTLENIFDDSESEDDFEAYGESEFSIGSENFSDDEFLSPNCLKCGDFVVVIENNKSMKTYSIGEITEIMEHEIDLNYYQRNNLTWNFQKQMTVISMTNEILKEYYPSH
ncbi:hypothetical protein JTB14_035135 [Gonioctena quinquepunctata]|nr:hypothetical protein JTB14_035135 [Gonioctena quinquepunctata]